MTLDEILAVESISPKRRGDGWVGFCPAHNDGAKSGNRSLSINQRGDRLMLFCFAGCSFADVIDALGGPSREPDPVVRVGKWTDSRSDQMSRDDSLPVESSPATKTVYLYVDADGETIGRVERLDRADGSKTFRPFFRPDGRPGYPDEWKGEPRRPLYRLDDLAVPFGDVWIAEGEKAADAIRAAGGCATTSPSGSSQARHADWSPLQGRDVIVWPDNDEPGRKFAATVVEILKPIAASVRVVDVDALSLAEKEDAADVADLDLDAIAFVDPNRNRWTMTDAEWKTVEYPPETEIVGSGIMVAQSLHLLVGEGGAGKSTIAWQIAETIAYGGGSGHFLGFPVASGQVVFLMGEGHGSHIRSRVDAARNALGIGDDDLGRIHVVRSEKPQVGPELEECLDEIDGDVLLTVLDLYSHFSTVQENDASDIKHNLINPLRAIAARTGSAFLLIHHLGKKSEYRQGKDLIRGSTAWFNDCDSVLRFSSPYGSNETTRLLEFDKLKHGRPIDPVVCEFDFDTATVSASEEDPVAVRRPAIKVIREYLEKHGETKRKEIAVHVKNEIGIHESAVTEALKIGVERGEFNKSGRGLYSPLPSPELRS